MHLCPDNHGINVPFAVRCERTHKDDRVRMRHFGVCSHQRDREHTPRHATMCAIASRGESEIDPIHFALGVGTS